MPKINITSFVTIVSTLSLVAAVGLASGLADQACAQNNQWGAHNDRQKNPLPETTKLEQNDNLDPTVNRTQAMRTEAETGSIAPITGTTKLPIVKPKARTPIKSTRGKKIIHVY